MSTLAYSRAAVVAAGYWAAACAAILLAAASDNIYRLAVLAAGLLMCLAAVPLTFAMLRLSARRRESRRSGVSPRATEATSAHAHTRKQPALLVLKGGGAKGLALLGAVAELSTHYQFVGVAGTSAGAITAALLGVGYTPAQIIDLFMEKRLAELIDRKRAPSALWDLVMNGYLYEGTAFLTWLGDVLKPPEKPSPHRPRFVFVYSTQVGRGLRRAKLHAQAIGAWADEIRGSMSIPFVFAEHKTAEACTLYDGGLLANFPVYEAREDIAECDPSLAAIDVVAVYLGRRPQADAPSAGPGSFSAFRAWMMGWIPFREVLRVAGNAGTVWLEQREPVWLGSEDGRNSTCFVDAGPIATLDFYLTQDEKAYLVELGVYEARRFLARKQSAGGHVEAPIRLRQLRAQVLAERRRAWGYFALASAIAAAGVVCLYIAGGGY